jgi:hypothetical protein
LIGSTGAYALVESVDDVVMLENYGTPEDLDGFYVKFCYSVSGVSRSYLDVSKFFFNLSC